MEPEGWLPHSQESGTYPHAEPQQSSSDSHPTPFWYLPIFAYVFQVASLPFSSLKTLYAFLLSLTRATFPTHLIFLNLITRTFGEE